MSTNLKKIFAEDMKQKQMPKDKAEAMRKALFGKKAEK